MFEDLLAAIATSPVADALKTSRIAYPLVNAAHILALGTVFGAILALDLRLLGLFRSVPATVLAGILPRVAGTGLCFAMATGAALFTVEPADYAANPAFLLKIGLVAIGTLHAIGVHASSGWRELCRTGAISASLRASAALSIAIWAGAIIAGRFIGFMV